MNMISAIVLAAGLSTRMGRPKLVLPWGKTTVIGQVVITLAHAGIEDIVVVTGGARDDVELALRDGPTGLIRTVYNPRYAEDDMLESLRIGIGVMREMSQGALITLGDQPQIEVGVIRGLMDVFQISEWPLIIPSYRMRRGHPWIVARSLWVELLSTRRGFTMRDFLNAHGDQIEYLPVETASVVQDIDTPEDYARWNN